MGAGWRFKIFDCREILRDVEWTILISLDLDKGEGHIQIRVFLWATQASKGLPTTLHKNQNMICVETALRTGLLFCKGTVLYLNKTKLLLHKYAL
jgi:hypothetical protein